MKILEKYLLKESFKPFIGALGVFTSLFLIDMIISKLSLIIQKKLSFMTVVSLFGYNLPAMIALTIPMAILFASIMTFGKLSIDNELTAIKSCGVSIYRLLRPLYLLVILFSCFMLYFNHIILPDSNYYSRDLLIHIAYRNPISNIKTGVFNKNQNISDLVIYAGDKDDKYLRDVVIYNKGQRETFQIVSAKYGAIDLANNGNDLVARLYEGEIHEKSLKNPNSYRVVKFKRFNFNIFGSTGDGNLRHTLSDREMNTKVMMDKIGANQEVVLTSDSLRAMYHQKLEKMEHGQEYDALTTKMLQEENKSKRFQGYNYAYWVEIHKKNALAFACIIFLFLGIPVGLMAKSSGVGAAFGFSMVVFVLYHSMLIGGEELADRGFMAPWLSMWMANIVLVVLGILLTWKSRHDTNAFDSIRFKVRKFFRKFAKKEGN